jgi:hypothetical protein
MADNSHGGSWWVAVPVVNEQILSATRGSGREKNDRIKQQHLEKALGALSWPGRSSTPATKCNKTHGQTRGRFRGFFRGTVPRLSRPAVYFGLKTFSARLCQAASKDAGQSRPPSPVPSRLLLQSVSATNTRSSTRSAFRISATSYPLRREGRYRRKLHPGAFPLPPLCRHIRHRRPGPVSHGARMAHRIRQLPYRR